MANIVIRIATAHDTVRWDRYVHDHPAASPYHLWAWREAVTTAYGHRGVYLLAEEENIVKGILPLIHMRLPLVLNQLVALPFCDLGGPLADTPEIAAALLQEAVHAAERLHNARLEIRSREEAESIVDGGEWKCNSSKVSMLLELPSSSDKLWASFKSKLRSQVRKAEKNGLVFRWGTVGDLDDFYAVFSRNMRDLGSPVHAKEWLKAVLEQYGENARMGLVYKDDMAVGCGILLFTRKRIAIPWASTLRQYNRLAPNMLLYWNFLRFAADTGFSQFDFGRSTPNEGTYRFKAQWGARPVALKWYRWPSQEVEQPTATAGGSQLATLWAKLPIRLTNIAGPLIRGYISL